MTCSFFLHEETVGTFILQKDDIRKQLCVQERLKLALRLDLDSINHLSVVVVFLFCRNICALIDGQDEFHTLSHGLLGGFDTGVDAPKIKPIV